MIWILIWLAVTPSGNMEYYHLGTYSEEKLCGNALSKAHILVTGKGQTISCIPIDNKTITK